MIFVIDDDGAFRDTVEYALNAEDYRVLVFDNAQSALAKASEVEPELIISDIMMPEMGGFEFKKVYSKTFPNRMTPFVFLSSLSDDDNIVQGLDMGVDDYLTKPINSAVLKAKVRSLINRKKRYSVPVFRGDLAKLPPMKLLQFCEYKGITGNIEISGVSGNLRLPIKQGELVLEDNDDTLLDRLYDCSEGTFTISAEPVDFREISDAESTVEPESVYEATDIDRPMGKLSGVQINNRLFQVQTEFVTHPDSRVITIVILDGKVLMNRTTQAPSGKPDKKTLEKLIESQHRDVEADIRDKISVLLKNKTSDQDVSRDRFNLLFEEGFDRYREGRYDAALALWEKALTINPDDKILDTNLKMLRKKMNHDW